MTTTFTYNEFKSEKPISDKKRKEILQEYINRGIKDGYYVVSQTSTTAQLKKDKGFSCLLFTILFLLGILPAIIYLLVRTDKTTYVSVDEYGVATGNES